MVVLEISSALEYGGRLTTRVYAPYSFICKFIRKKKRNTRKYNWPIRQNLTNSTLHLICHYITLTSFPWEDTGRNRAGMPCWQWKYFWSASGQEADDPMLLKKPSNLSKKNFFQSTNISFSVHITQKTIDLYKALYKPFLLGGGGR